MVFESQDPDERVEEIRRAYREPQAFPLRLGLVCLALLIVLLGALLGRVGSDLARLSAATLVGACWIALWVMVQRERKKWREPAFVFSRSLRRVDKELAGRVARAYSLWRKTEEGAAESKPLGESPELARAHLLRLSDEIPLEGVVRVGTRLRKGILSIAIALAGASFFLLQFRMLMIVEGIDIILAQNGVGPYSISYVWSVSVTAEYPGYLDGSAKKRVVSSRLAMVPMGSEVEVRVVPQNFERDLLLTDGHTEVPFVSDGQGGLVARFLAEEESDLRVGSRFGDVILFDAHETRVSPRSDLVPLVVLEGAGQRLALKDLRELSLSFMATDDHGISQIDLVLRSGQRSTRTELARLDGQKRSYRGAYTLTREHELLQRAFLPIRVSIEARDANASTELSWGTSEVIVLVPEPLGHEVKKRHLALRAYRGALTSYLAADMAAAHVTIRDAQDARELALEELRQQFLVLSESLWQSGSPPRRSLAFLKAQLEALAKKGVERATPESVLLATDALIGNISRREAERLAEDLGSAVEEIAVQAREIRFNAEGVHLVGIFDLLEGAQAGAEALREVGVLGLDLGSVARGDLARVERSLKAKAYDHAEAAALHLAERLKRGTPSFSSKGGGGVESGPPKGGGSGTGAGESDGESSSEAPSQFNEMSRKLDELAQDAASELGELERLLKEAQRAAEADFENSPELEEATERLKEALDRLPRRSSGPGGAMAEAAAARSQGEAMADALEAGDLREGIERGLDADSSLQRALEQLPLRPSWLDQDDLHRAQRALREVLTAARAASEKLKKKQEGGVNESLRERSELQREFAERARKLAQRGREPGAPLGEEGVESLQRAAQLLERAAIEMAAGRGEAGTSYAQEAQTQLERALPDEGEGSLREGPGDEGDASTRGAVPDEERDRAREFRERVEKGLGRRSGGLAPAVRRYAEELK